MATIYISCVHADAEFADALKQLLVDFGHTPWSFSDQFYKNLSPGKHWQDAVDDQIQRVDAVVSVVSSASLHNKRCSYELEAVLGYAKKKGKPFILPVMLGDVSLDPLLSQYLCIRSPDRDAKEVAIRIDGALKEPLVDNMVKTRRNSQSILIVDDEPNIALVLKLQLEDAGYKTTVAKNSSECLRLVSKEQFSLTLLDINMPGLNGVDLFHHIRNKDPFFPAVMMTGHGSEDMAIEALQSGALDYLPKPFSTDDMLKKVDNAISLSIVQAENRALLKEREELFQATADEMVRLQDRLANIMQTGANSFVKSIEFDEDTYQAGIAILSYFSTIVKQKYPEMKVKIRIEQEGRTVRLVIETPDGEKEKIEKTLEDYGLVVVGKMQPEELLPVKIEELQLRHKLDMAVMEISHTRELLSFTKESHNREITSLKEEVGTLKEQIHEAFKREDHARGVLVNIINSYSVDGIAKNAILTLSGYLESRVFDKDKEIILELLGIIKQEHKPAFDDIKAYMISSLSGASGNLISSWIPLVFAALPRI